MGTEIAKKKTSIALHGFLHCEDCISYWDYGTIGVGDNAAKVDGSAINTRYRPEIYVIKMDPSDENLEQFNKAIRDKEVRRIPIKEVNAEELGEIVQVVRVDELMVDVQPVGSVGSDSIRREKIPAGIAWSETYDPKPPKSTRGTRPKMDWPSGNGRRAQRFDGGTCYRINGHTITFLSFAVGVMFQHDPGAV